jgi:hypothetical protein
MQQFAPTRQNSITSNTQSSQKDFDRIPETLSPVAPHGEDFQDRLGDSIVFYNGRSFLAEASYQETWRHAGLNE